LNDIHSSAAIHAGIMIVINTDAHNISQLDLMKYGITQARRAGATAANVLNTLPLEAFRKKLNR
jgi:DNA polymerase (family X)